MGIIQEKGINDMPKGWAKKTKWNYKVYNKWKSMLERVYEEKYHNKQPTYINATLQLEMHWLSYFVEHFKEIDGYDEEKFLKGELELDKDIKSNGTNKEYSIENCMLVSKSINSKQANKTRDYSNIKKERNGMYNIRRFGENNPRALKVIQCDKQGNIIKIWDYIKQASLELKIKDSNISECCKGKRKSAGGFIWRYYKEEK